MLTAKTREALEEARAWLLQLGMAETMPVITNIEIVLASVSGSQGQWQPIESAPKNRSLVYVPHFGITIALPCSDGTWWSDEVPDQTCLPTLWWPMPPLPPPPADPTTGR